MRETNRQLDVEQLRARVAVLEQLQEAQERAVLEQAQQLQEAIDQAREQARRLAQSEEAHRHQTHVLQSILAGMGDGVVVADATGHAVLVNPAARKILGADVAATSPADRAARFESFLP